MGVFLDVGGKKNCVTALLEAGANKGIKNADGKLPYEDRLRLHSHSDTDMSILSFMFAMLLPVCFHLFTFLSCFIIWNRHAVNMRMSVRH